MPAFLAFLTVIAEFGIDRVYQKQTLQSQRANVSSGSNSDWRTAQMTRLPIEAASSSHFGQECINRHAHTSLGHVLFLNGAVFCLGSANDVAY